MHESPAVEHWHRLLSQGDELTPAFWDSHAARMREARLTFGDRLHCPFLRPFFLGPDDEKGLREVGEAIAAAGERVARAALEDEGLLRALGLTEGEEALVRIDPGYGTASTASRVDAFLLPDAIWCAEYNAESPAGPGYTETLSEIFDRLPVMARFRETWHAEHYRLCDALLEALVASYREWGGTANPPTIAIVDWRGVPTWSEFEILQARFEARGVPTLVGTPEQLEFDGKRLRLQGRTIDLLYRRVLINDVVAKADRCRAIVDACRARAVCMANNFRCKIAHKKAFFAILTDDRFERLFSASERARFAAHVPWTRVVAAARTCAPGGDSIDLPEYIRRYREQLVLKPNDEYGGSGVALGWEMAAADWDRVLDEALAATPGSWVVQRRIPVRREPFPMVDTPYGVVMRDMLVDIAPYLFRGRMAGFLTRLSSTGLANVTSGGGQVPAFRVERKPR